MTNHLTITDETEVEFTRTDVQDVHLNDLSFILDVTHDGETVQSCTIDLAELVQAMTLYSSMEEFRYNWR